MIKSFFSLILSCLFTITFLFCQQTSVQGTWIRKADFPGSSRNYGLGFSIGTKGYYGMGQKQTKPFVYKSYNDFWEYDVETNTWTQKSDFPGEVRLRAKGFSVNNKIYVGFGYIIAPYGANAGSNTYQVDLYEFDPPENKWVKKNDGYLGRGDICFVIKDTMYAVNPEYRTLNKYNSLTDTWFESKWEKNAIAPNNVDISRNDIVFSTGEKEYIIKTIKKRNIYINQLWELNPHTITWKQKNDLPIPGNDTLNAFSVGEKGYVVRGDNDVLEYDPALDKWTAKDGGSADNKYYSQAFSIGGKSYGFSKYKFWEFTP